MPFPNSPENSRAGDSSLFASLGDSKMVPGIKSSLRPDQEVVAHQSASKLLPHLPAVESQKLAPALQALNHPPQFILAIADPNPTTSDRRQIAPLVFGNTFVALPPLGHAAAPYASPNPFRSGVRSTELPQSTKRMACLIEHLQIITMLYLLANQLHLIVPFVAISL